MIRRTLIALAAIATVTTAQACGPDFFPDVFVRADRPDLPQQYVAGQLGILHTDFPSADLFVAYRYLSGGTLSVQERTGWAPTYSIAEQTYGTAPVRPYYEQPQPDAAVVAWANARARFTSIALADVDPTLQKKTTTPDGYSYDVTVTNCADDAFRTAAATLQARAATWGKSSTQLADWIQAQDAVFHNCGTEDASPKPAPAGSPQLLQQDRAYQTAAANFYAGKLQVAAEEFDAIAADKSSPWNAIAGYVAGRALLRKAFLDPIQSDTPVDFNEAALLNAQQHIDRYLATHPPQQWAHAAEMQRNLIRIRLQPEARTRELAAAVTGPVEDWNYEQDVQDILWLFRSKVPDGLRAQPELWEQVKSPDGKIDYRTLTPGQAQARALTLRDKAFSDSAEFRSAASLFDWTITIRSLAPAAAPHALERWKSTRQQAWLVAALMLAPENAIPDPALLKAAAEVQTGSPAYQTVAYHRARLQLALGDAAAARTTLTALRAALGAEASAQQQPSTRNAIQSLEARAAFDTSSFIAHLGQTVLLAASENSGASRACKDVMVHKSNWHRCLKPGTQDLDTSAARLLNEQAPLTLWVEAAKSPAIPQPLRQAIAMQGWTRATLLGNSATAGALQPLLPEPLQQQLATNSPLTKWVALARNPGMQPNLDPGTQRAYTYDFVEDYRDNWCYNPTQFAEPQPTATALTPADRAQAAAEVKALSTFRSVDVGNHILKAVAANPQDPQAPESLYLVLRMIRYGCNPVHEPDSQQDSSLRDRDPDAETGNQLLKLRRNTAALMRRYYASNPWTRKAAPFVGEVHPPPSKS